MAGLHKDHKNYIIRRDLAPLEAFLKKILKLTKFMEEKQENLKWTSVMWKLEF